MTQVAILFSTQHTSSDSSFLIQRELALHPDSLVDLIKIEKTKMVLSLTLFSLDGDYDIHVQVPHSMNKRSGPSIPI